jgi:hypothetical protein
MPLFLRILCRAPEPVIPRELATFIRDGWFFEEPVRFEPVLEGTWATEPRWKSIEIHYQVGKRPVLVEHLFDSSRVAEEVDEALEAARSAGLLQSQAALVERIRACQRVFLFEVDPLNATDECWTMLDATEAFLARARDGVIFVAGEGFYDAALQPICTLQVE